MADNEIKIKITGKDEASPTIKAAIDKLSESVIKLNEVQNAASEAASKQRESSEGLNGGLVNLAAGVSLVKAGLEVLGKAFDFVSQHMHKAVEEALQAEQANNRLKGALVSTGQFTRALTKELDDYSEAQEKASGFSSELIKTNIAMGVQMGLTADRAKDMELAARKLAAATGDDLETAFQKMKMSLTGNARGLATVIPGIKDLGAAQLKSGAAIDIVNKKLDDQYKLYNDSLTAAINRAKVAYSNIYEELGKIVTESPAVRQIVNATAEAFDKLAELVKQNSAEISDFVSKGLAGLVATLPIAIDGINAMDTGFTYLVNTLRMAMAGFTTLAGGFVKLVSVLPDSLFKSMGIDIESSKQSLESFQDALYENVQTSMDGLEQRKSGYEAVKTVVEDYSKKVTEAAEAGVKGHKAAGDAADVQREKASALNAEYDRLTQTYADINIGNEKSREALKLEAADRDKSLKDFKEYLDNKKRLAVTAEQEQQLELAKVRAAELEGAGSKGTEAKADLTIQNEQNKQAQLAELRNQNIIDEQEYQAALSASRQAAMEAEITSELAHREAKANAMGESEEAFAEKLAIAEERYQQEQAIRNARYEQERLTAEERKAAEEEAKSQFDQQQKEMTDEHQDAIAQKEEITGQTVTNTRDKFFKQQEKGQKDAIKGFLSGTTAMVNIQGAMNQSFSQLGDALVKNQKISASKMVGVFLQMLGTQVQQKGMADLVMGIFPPNPVQLAIGGAEVALGTAIGRLGNSMQGGQADEGNDFVPQPLSGKSFVVSGGERIVQPSANRDLKDFLNREKQGSTTVGGSSYNITLNYNGSGGQADAERMADIVIEQIRTRSERGAPIMSEKGLTKT